MTPPRQYYDDGMIQLDQEAITLRRYHFPSGTSKIIRLQVTRTQAAKLRKALAGRKGLDVTLQLDATAAAGQPTSETERIQATA